MKTILILLCSLALLCGCGKRLAECPRCGHMFRSSTGKSVVSWVDWDQKKQTVFFCRPCSPIYDEVEYAEGQYVATTDGKTLIGGVVSRGFIDGIEVDDDGVVLTNRSVRFMTPRLVFNK